VTPLDYSQPTISKAVDILVANDLVVAQREGNAKQVHINRGRLSRSDDLSSKSRNPNSTKPVRTAVNKPIEKLEDVVGIVPYGSVARGDADRRSDIDLWVLIEEDRMANQRTANRVRQDSKTTNSTLADTHTISMSNRFQPSRTIPMNSKTY